MISINRWMQGYYHRRHQSHRTTIIVLLLLLLSLSAQQVQVQVVNGFSSTTTANMLIGRAHQSSPLLSFSNNKNHRPIRRPTTTAIATAAPTRLSRLSMVLLPVPNEHLLRIAESYVPKLGIMSSIFLYLAPAKAVWDAILKAKKKQKNSNTNTNTNSLLDGLNPIPIAIMPCVAISWFIYGLISNDPYIIIGNGIGSVLSIAYLIGILPLMNNNNNNMNNTNNNNNSDDNNKQLFWTQITVLLSTITTLGLWSILGFLTSNATDAQISFSNAQSSVNSVLGEALGIYASILFIILCSSPLSTISNVIKTKNSSSILGRLTISQCINTSLWSIYGLTVNDRFIYGPNIIVSYTK
jgi:solute carrier family 50 protein (sugar transporter)